MIQAVLAALTVLSGLAVGGCSTSAQEQLTVSAAASLTDAFTELGEAFEQDNPGLTVRFNFAGSSSLAEQIVSGAPVDVFAAASLASITRAAEELTEPAAFATNSLAIALPLGNPAGVLELADLADPNVTVVICGEPVPCGSAATGLFARNDLDVTPASLEPDVRSVLTKVVSDEADAGIVYRTDVIAARDQIESITIPDGLNVSNEYFIAATTNSPAQAATFVDFVLSDRGRAILQSWGFDSP